MSLPKAHATFLNKGEHTFRSSTYIQWGNSTKSIGSCLLLNPGSAEFLNRPSTLNGAITGEVRLDPTMQQLVKLINEIYQDSSSIEGRLHIYNLFTLLNPKSENAIETFEHLVNTGELVLRDNLVAPVVYHIFLTEISLFRQ